MVSSIRRSRIQSEIEETYDGLQDVNKELREVQTDIYRESFRWNLISGGLETSDRPEYWADPSGRDIWGLMRDGRGLEEWGFGLHLDDLVRLRVRVRTKLKDLGDFRKELEDFQHEYRLIINKLYRLSGPGLRNILDMPEEILYHIFELVEGFSWQYPDFWHFPSGDIKNCRLTCQAFNCVSSRFFLRSVSVELNASSLSKFNEISNHPTISKGIQFVRAILHFYETSLGDSLRDFILYNADVLRDRLQSIELMRPWKYEKNVSEETGNRVVETLKETLACWERIATDTQAQSLADQDRTYLELLKATHQRYQSLCSYQEEMLQSGSFLQAVAAGVSRMPCAKTMFFCDQNLAALPRISFLHSQDINETLCEFMLQPMSYYTAMQYGFTPRLCDLITKLPVAVHHAGAWLGRIDIDLSHVDSPSDLTPSPELRQQLPLAMQRLRQFTIRCTNGLNGETSQDVLNDMFGSCLDTGSLREISIEMPQKREPHSDKLSVGRIITSRHWQNLSRIFLRGVAFHFSELQLFISRAPKSFYALNVDRVYLLSGTWADVLDTLREKPLIAHVQLEDPLGAECDDMSVEELKRIFFREVFTLSQAEQYISRLTPQNPLRDQEGLDHNAAVVGSEDEMETEL
ncbi:unnamed protein product [Clonostachys solani]|uniref:F-box domain-containing protein n=1 Tax=Clonostachys solani TaxID=160281 RepID=A0A9N9W744_9HYPO|nr:unnamed protein product [Clonostachys solani]